MSVYYANQRTDLLQAVNEFINYTGMPVGDSFLRTLTSN